MKKFVIVLSVVFLSNINYSQNLKGELKEVKLEDVIVSSLNLDYLEKVQDESMSTHVKSLENRASRLDITTSAKYDGREDAFKAVIKSSKGSIIAMYDKDGKIISTSEKFKNIKLPDHVRVSVFDNHPNWVLLSDTYSVLYHRDKDVKKVFKIQIGNGNLKKNLKIYLDKTNMVITAIDEINTNSKSDYVSTKN